MRQEAPALQLWLAHEGFQRDRHEVDLAQRAPRATETPTLRHRLGRAVIAFGERLTGEAPGVPDAQPRPRRRLAARPS